MSVLSSCSYVNFFRTYEALRSRNMLPLIWLWLLGCIVLTGGPTIGLAEENTDTPIASSWKAMDEGSKRQFIAGYLFGFRDARALGEIAVEYSKSNPKDTTVGLTDLLSHYRLTNLSPTELVPLLNEYFKDPKNQSDSLRAAIAKLAGGR